MPIAVLLLAACSPKWTVAFEADEMGALSGVWGTAPDDVWMVGGAAGTALVRHYDGTSWSDVSTPAEDLMVWVHGTGADDVWSVGQSGQIVHFDGSDWTSIPSGTTEDLWGVWASAPDDVWIVGGDVEAGDPLILRGNVDGFVQVPLPSEQNDREARSLFKIYGHEGRLFAVGQGGLIVEWDGTTWQQMPAGAAADEDFVSLWAKPDGTVTAVGGRAGSRLAVLDGSSWTTTSPTGVPGLNAVTVADDTVLVGGTSGFVGRVDGEEVVWEEGPIVTSHDIHAMWDDGEGTTWTVGGRFYEPYAGTAWRRDR